MEPSNSWFVPRLPVHGAPSAIETVFVLFLERLPERSRSGIVEKLKDGDNEWARRFDADFNARGLTPVPWIRDNFPSSRAILQYVNPKDQRGENEQYKSFIFVDSGWEANTCIAATWQPVHDGAPLKLTAARVPMSIANLLLSAIDSGATRSLSEALGSEVYEDCKVDFYKDLTPPPQHEVAPYTPPAFIPEDLHLSKSTLPIIALEHMDEEVIASLRSAILEGKEADDHPPALQIINWEGEPAPRSHLVKLFTWLHDNTPENDRIGYAFFIDNIMQSGSGGPQIIAASRTAAYSNAVNKHQVCVLPVATKGVIPLWTAAAIDRPTDQRAREAGTADSRHETQHGNIWARERIIDLDYPPNFADDGGSTSFPPVFLLRPFTLSEERTIRKNLTTLADIEEGEDWGKEFAFLPSSLLPSTATPTLTTDMLSIRTYLERHDPFSPQYTPTSTPTFPSFPSHFFACDTRALDQEHPKVILASSLDFYHENNELGWLYGYSDADMAGSNFTNLDIANMGPSEMMDDEEGVRLWLSDLKGFREEDWDEEEGMGDGDEGGEDGNGDEEEEEEEEE